MSELKCCKKCGAFYTCTHKGKCCPECQWYDPTDDICLAIPDTLKSKPKRKAVEDDEIDPETFLFEDDDDEDEDLSDLPPERESEYDEDEDFDIMEDDDW